jgi:hypothetical protein
MSYLKNPYLWASGVVLGASLMVAGWARSYPVSYAPAEVPVLDSVSPIFWPGLGFSFAGLAGLVLTSQSRYVHWLATILFVLFLTAPQFLYLSWGSDAGALPEFVGYIQSVGSLDLQRDIAEHTYFQWPVSILFHSFLADALAVGEYTAVQIGFFFVIICVAGGLFILWSDGLPRRPNSSRAVFWGIVAYFAGFYWLLNWQAVPYAFTLALFFPMLALLSRRSWQDTILILLLFAVGIESHALFGIWGTAIVAMLLVLGMLTRRTKLAISLALLMAVAQLSLILYKNTWFFRDLILSLQGYYRALLETGTSDKALAAQTLAALNPLPEDLVGAVLKVLSWLDLAFIGVAFAVATLVVIRNRRLRNREIALLGTGSLHFAVGVLVAAVGTRSIQLLAMVPAFFVIDGLERGGRAARWAILVASVMGLLLFPAAIVRSHQQSHNYVSLSSSLLAKTMAAAVDEEGLTDAWILGEHNVPRESRLRPYVSSRFLQYRWGLPGFESWLEWLCDSDTLVIDTPQLRKEWAQIAGYESDAVADSLASSSVIYHSGSASLRTLPGYDLPGLCDSLR